MVRPRGRREGIIGRLSRILPVPVWARVVVSCVRALAWGCVHSGSLHFPVVASGLSVGCRLQLDLAHTAPASPNNRRAVASPNNGFRPPRAPKGRRVARSMAGPWPRVWSEAAAAATTLDPPIGRGGNRPARASWPARPKFVFGAMIDQSLTPKYFIRTDPTPTYTLRATHRDQAEADHRGRQLPGAI